MWSWMLFRLAVASVGWTPVRARSITASAVRPQSGKKVGPCAEVERLAQDVGLAGGAAAVGQLVGQPVERGGGRCREGGGRGDLGGGHVDHRRGRRACRRGPRRRSACGRCCGGRTSCGDLPVVRPTGSAQALGGAPWAPVPQTSAGVEPGTLGRAFRLALDTGGSKAYGCGSVPDFDRLPPPEGDCAVARQPRFTDGRNLP